MAESPNLKLHLTGRAEKKNFVDWRLEENGTEAGSNMMVLDREITAVKDRVDKHIIVSEQQPADDVQTDGDIWYKIIG